MMHGQNHIKFVYICIYECTYVRKYTYIEHVTRTVQ